MNIQKMFEIRRKQFVERVSFFRMVFICHGENGEIHKSSGVATTDSDEASGKVRQVSTNA